MFSQEVVSRFAEEHLLYAIKFHPTWEFGSFAVASRARLLKLNGYSCSALIRKQINMGDGAESKLTCGATETVAWTWVQIPTGPVEPGYPEKSRTDKGFRGFSTR
jgi:hypothetical protein